MAEPIRNLTIVGGGTAGWLSAAFLSAVTKGKIDITVIESARIGAIGVGESTAPTFPRTFKTIGVSEKDVFKRCNASFKVATVFRNWNVDRSGKGVAWANPFAGAHYIGGLSPGYYFKEYEDKRNGKWLDFTEYVSPCSDVIKSNKGPREIKQAEFEQIIPYAYHLDALKAAELLKEKAMSRGVRHIVDDVKEVKLDERGFVSALELAENGAHSIEFVIDCTGFRSLILQQTLEEPFEPYSKYLLNDRAVVVQTPHETPAQIPPASFATALSAGWVFHLPLYGRVGTGYVHSSQFLSEDEAIEEFLAYLGKRGEGAEPRVIKIKTGNVRRPWVNNCVAVGLSSGFVEPLEATAIHVLEVSLQFLYGYFPDSDFDPSLQKRYNRMMNSVFDEVLEFICLHFYLNNRTDSDYWRTVREELPIPSRLEENLELWRHTMPHVRDVDQHYFTHFNYLCALMNKGFYSNRAPRMHGLERAPWDEHLRVVRPQFKRAASLLPDHAALIRHMRGETAAPARLLPGLGG